MPFPQHGFDPETIALLDTCLEDTVAIAAARVTIGDGLRQMFAAALLEGYARHGLRERAELAGFALRALPTFRNKEPRLTVGA